MIQMNVFHDCIRVAGAAEGVLVLAYTIHGNTPVLNTVLLWASRCGDNETIAAII